MPVSIPRICSINDPREDGQATEGAKDIEQSKIISSGTVLCPPGDGFAYRRTGVDLPLLGLSSALFEIGPRTN